MTKKEEEIYKKALKEKYRFHTLWKVLTIIFMITTIVFAGLYFGSGEVFREEITENNIEVINEGDGDNTNSIVINN